MMPAQAFQRALDNIPYARYLGIELDGDSGIFRLNHRPELIGNNQLQAIHGGVVGGFLENVAMLWVGLSQHQAATPKPVDFSLDYLRPARAQTCFASCTVVRQGRRLAAAQVRCWQEDENKLIATARGHYLLKSE